MVRSMIGGMQRYAAQRRNTDPVMSTVLDVAGLAIFSYGAWLVYRPAGFLVGGLALLLLGYLTRPAGAR
jgi:hypothetical protein